MNVVIIVSFIHSAIVCVEGFRSFPGEVRVALDSEVTKAGGLLVDGSTELELLDDVTRAEVEVLANNASEELVILSTLNGAVGVDPDAEWVSQSNSVRNLDTNAMAEFGVYKRFSNKSGEVGSGSIDLGGVLSRVGTTSMGTPTTIRVDDDLSSSETGIGTRASFDERAGRVDDVNGIRYQEFSRADLLDDLLNESVADDIIVHIRAVLGGDEDVVDLGGLQVFSFLSDLVLNNDLRFAVRSEPGDFTTLSLGGHFLINSACQLMGERVECLLIILVSSIAEHNSLVTSTEVFELLADVDAVGDLGRLCFDNIHDVAFSSAESLLPRVVTNSITSISCNLFKVYLLFGAADLSQ